MSRKARVDKSSWLLPSVHVFAGDYGPFKIRSNTAIENVLVLLASSIGFDDVRRHPMLYKHAAQAQNILLGEEHRHGFDHIMVIDVAAMVTGEDGSLKDMIQKEVESIEPVRGFGKSLVRLFQRMGIRNAVLAAEGDLCCVLLKIYDALRGEDIANEIWLLHPSLSPGFVNNHLVPMGKRGANSLAKSGKKGKSTPLQLHLVFQNESARDKRLAMVRHVFPYGTTDVIPAQEHGVFFAAFGNTGTNPEGVLEYDPDFYNTMGKSLFMSKLTVEMNKHSKQYETLVRDVTETLLLEVEKVEEDNGAAKDIDWESCERHVGALVLRGNRCVLVRSLSNEWKGMRIPSVPVVPKSGETEIASAIRAVAELTGVDESEVTSLEMIPHVNVYAPNGRPIIVKVHKKMHMVLFLCCKFTYLVYS